MPGEKKRSREAARYQVAVLAAEKATQRERARCLRIAEGWPGQFVTLQGLSGEALAAVETLRAGIAAQIQAGVAGRDEED
jgi:hypothetical protein